MKKSIIIILVLFISFPLYGRNFDFNQIYGISPGMKLDKALTLLKNKGIGFYKEKNDNGSFSFGIDTTIKLFGKIYTSEIVLLSNNNRISSIRIQIDYDYEITHEILSKNCNCLTEIIDDDEEKYSYFYDNCTIYFARDFIENEYTITILNIVKKCRK